MTSDYKLKFDFSVIHPEVREYFGNITCLVFNKGDNFFDEFWFIEDTIGVPRGTIYHSLTDYYAKKQRDEYFIKMKHKIACMEELLNER